MRGSGGSVMREEILSAVDNGMEAIAQLKEDRHVAFMEAVAHLLADGYSKGKKVIIAGNGGSLCDASHFAEELTGYFRGARKALPAIALSEPGHITCVGNDVGFDQVFSRGVEAYGQPGDTFVGLTTSGNSANIIRAVEAAQSIGLTTVCFLGKSGGKLRGVADYEMLIEGFATSDRIQEAHMASIHIIIEMVEKQLFSTGMLKTEAATL